MLMLLVPTAREDIRLPRRTLIVFEVDLFFESIFEITIKFVRIEHADVIISILLVASAFSTYAFFMFIFIGIFTL